MIKNIAILTSGGDAPGMNSAVATFIRYSKSNNIKPYVVRDGYLGLVNNKIDEATLEYADEIMSKSGTCIGSARFVEFEKDEVAKRAVKNLNEKEINALIVIGGDGSFKGALKLSRMGINCIGLPGTIDNDIASSDYTIGFDSALNVVVDYIDMIRNTMNSHNRCGIIEAMGNNCGELSLISGAATGCEIISINEKKLTEDLIIEKIKKMKEKNRRSVIILVSEKMYNVHKLAEKVERNTGYVTKANIIGHIQRGARVSVFDRYLSYSLTIRAIDELIKGNKKLCIGIIDNKIQALDIEKALKMKRVVKNDEIKHLFKLQQCFTNE